MTVNMINSCSEFADELNVFSTEAYLKSMSTNYGWFVSESFILPYLRNRKFFLNTLTFTSGSIHRGAEKNTEQEQQFLEQVVKCARDQGVDLITQPRTNALFNSFPRGSVHVAYGSYRIDLAGFTEAELFAALHQKHRNVIRKAQRDGIEISAGKQWLPQCHALICETLHRHGLPCISLEQMRGLAENLGSNLVCYLARHHGETQGAAILIRDANTCHYSFGGTRQTPHNGAMSLLHWTAILDMQNQGVKIYDFVGARLHPRKGSKQESIQRFKSRFGASLETGVLWKYLLVPWKYQLFKAVAFVAGRKLMQDIIDNELQCQLEMIEKDELQ